MPAVDIDAVWDFTDPASSEAKFRNLAKEVKVAGDAELLAELHTQIARAEGLQRKFEEAHHTLDQVETALSAKMKRARIRYLLERGRVLNSSQHLDDAKPLFLKAVEVGEAAHEDGLTVDA